jgi:hypothetical protein
MLLLLSFERPGVRFLHLLHWWSHFSHYCLFHDLGDAGTLVVFVVAIINFSSLLNLYFPSGAHAVSQSMESWTQSQTVKTPSMSVNIFSWLSNPSGSESSLRASTISLRHTTLSRTPLYEWSALLRDNTQHSQQTRHPWPRPDLNPQSQQSNGRRSIHVLDCAACGIGIHADVLSFVSTNPVSLTLCCLSTHRRATLPCLRSISKLVQFLCFYIDFWRDNVYGFGGHIGKVVTSRVRSSCERFSCWLHIQSTR